MLAPGLPMNPSQSAGWQSWQGNQYSGSNPLMPFALSDIQDNGSESAYLLDFVTAGYKLYTGWKNGQDMKAADFAAARTTFDAGGAITASQQAVVLKTFAAGFDRLNTSQLLDGGVDGFKAWQNQQDKQNQQNRALFQVLAAGKVPGPGGAPTAQFGAGQDMVMAQILSQRAQQQNSTITMVLILAGVYFIVKND